MKKIFLNDTPLMKNSIIDVEGDDYHHLARVLRVKIGEKFIIGDYDGNEYDGEVKLIDKKTISFLLGESHKRDKSQLPDVNLYFSLLKGDKNEFIIRKCTEIGVNAFIPVVTKNCVVNFYGKENKKIIRWNDIVKEASMQSGRRNLPKIFDIILFDEINKYDIKGTKIFGNTQEKKIKLKDVINNNLNVKSYSILIGPEGDFTNNEIDQLLKWGWQGVNLLENILTSEIAALFMSSAIIAHY